MSRYFKIRSKNGLFSYIIEKKAVKVIFALLVLTCLSLIVGTSFGTSKISFLDVIKVLLGQGSANQKLVVNVLRLPRVLAALFSGMALAAAGAILQGIIRNPLASPDIIGITGGASFAAVFFIAFLSGSLSIQWLPLAAIIGAGLVAILIYILAWDKGVTPTRLVLIGIGISSAMGALTTFMIIISPIHLASQAYIWLTGSVYGTKWSMIYSVLPWIITFYVLAIIFSRVVNIQEMGDQIAAGVGAPVQLHRFLLLFISVGLAGSAVALAGGIGFIGLIAPHIARKLVDRSFNEILIVSTLCGGIMVIVADLIARTAFTPLDVPAGVFTSGIGAPFFIYLLYKKSQM